MDLARKTFDSSYNILKPFLFYATKKDPERAHDWFIRFSKFLTATKLEKFVLDNKTNYNYDIPFEISNAAGLDKNAEISPMCLRYAGFNRVVIGTVTGENWPGYPRPRTKRIDENSLINNISWENDGAEIISNRLVSYKNYEVPITLSIGYTPDPKLSIEQRFEDLKKTINLFNGNGIQCISRIEYNPSCANLLISREENQKFLGEAVCFIKSHITPWQDLYVKVSPDMSDKELDDFIKVTYDFVDGYVTTNATTQHDFGVGSASGDVVYALSLGMQKKVYERLRGTDKKIIACGGINSVERAFERIEFELQEDKRIQVLTGLFYGGSGLLREFREVF